MAVNPSIQLGTSGNWAIKEDNLLAYKQLGNKFFDREFDFSRGTRATFVGRNGLIQESGLTSAELVTNGDFATDLSGWAIGGTDATNTITWETNGVRFISTTNLISIQQSNILTIGKSYKLTCDVAITTGSIGLDGATSGSSIVMVEGFNEIYFTAISNYVKIKRITANSNCLLDNVSVQEIQTDVPRIDFTDDPTGHLLLEPQSTNLFTYSNDFSQWYRPSASVINNVLVSPDGTLNADEFVFDGTNNGRIEKSVSTTNGLDYTFSIYLKNKDLSDVTQVWIGYSQTAQGQFVTITNEWQRFTTTQTANGTNEYPRVNYNGVGSLYAYGAQFEQRSYATSYIPTSGSAVTRNQELCDNSGTVNDFNSEEGVLYAEIAALADDGTSRRISLSDGSINNRVSLEIDETANKIKAFISSGGVSQVLEHTAADLTQNNKIAIKYKLNDMSIWLNGSEVVTDTSGNMPVGLDRLNFDGGDSNRDFFGKTKNLKVFKRALTDTELYLLTVTQYQSYQEMATALNYTL